MGLGIDIGVGGRFHADQLARAFLDRGHDVMLWSSYPASRFADVESERVQSLLWPEIAYRAMKKLGAENPGDLYKMRTFGRTLARRLEQSRRSDLFVGWSSFSLETLRLGHHRHRAIIRDSAHLRRQMEILDEAYARFGLIVPDRSQAMDREEEEYARAHTIFVLSEFARRSFLDRGVNAEKLRVLPLGVDTRVFQPLVRDGYSLPLRVVYFGSVSVRKGVTYLLDAVRGLPEVHLTVIGPVEPALRPKLVGADNIEWKPALPQAVLAAILPEQDVFVLPTLEDGFGQTLVQAMACGLIPISTDRCGAAEILRDGFNGRVVPAGSANAIREALQSYASDPAALPGVRKKVLASLPKIGWENYGLALEKFLDQKLR